MSNSGPRRNELPERVATRPIPIPTNQPIAYVPNAQAQYAHPFYRRDRQSAPRHDDADDLIFDMDMDIEPVEDSPPMAQVQSTQHLPPYPASLHTTFQILPSPHVLPEYPAAGTPPPAYSAEYEQPPSYRQPIHVPAHVPADLHATQGGLFPEYAAVSQVAGQSATVNAVVGRPYDARDWRERLQRREDAEHRERDESRRAGSSS